MVCMILECMEGEEDEVIWSVVVDENGWPSVEVVGSVWLDDVFG